MWACPVLETRTPPTRHGRPRRRTTTRSCSGCWRETRDPVAGDARTGWTPPRPSGRLSEPGPSTRAGALVSSRCAHPTGCGPTAPASRVRPTSRRRRPTRWPRAGHRRPFPEPDDDADRAKRSAVDRDVPRAPGPVPPRRTSGQRGDAGDRTPSGSATAAGSTTGYRSSPARSTAASTPARSCIGTYLGVDVEPVVQRLLADQMPDGGWNCWAETRPAPGIVRQHARRRRRVPSLEERATGGTDKVREARARGEEYLLQRRLFPVPAPGEEVRPEWSQFSYPPRWHYDLLKATDYFARRGVPDPRLDEAIDRVRAKRRRTAVGCSRTPTRARCTSGSRSPTARRAGGTP